MKYRSLFLSFAMLSLLPCLVTAQKEITSDKATQFIRQFYKNWDLQEEDVADLVISDQYTSIHNGVTHVYFQQRYKGININNAIWGTHLLPNGKIAYNAVKFQANLSKKIETTTPLISVEEALRKVLDYLELSVQKSIPSINEAKPNLYFYELSGIAEPAVRIELNYFRHNAEQLKLCWSIEITPKETIDSWVIQVDARSGDIINQESQTLSCNFDHSVGGNAFLGKCLDLNHQHTPSYNFERLAKTNNQPQYRVFPATVESPITGERQLLVDPSDPTASPFGWHDTDGQEGAEFITTRGNNVYAYRDRDGDNLPDIDTLFVEDLNFDFPFNESSEPTSNQEAALTQLFYMNNFMHDFTYHYGFDEAAGNYQALNYTGVGEEEDAVRAEAMDGSSVNNASFLITRDGNPGRMQMFLWTRASLQLLEVTAPEPVSGFYRAGTASFGPEITRDTAYTGKLVQALDGSNNPTLGCQTLINADQLNGNIAVISRGKCTFKQKVLNAEAAGATAAIIVNYNSGILGLGNFEGLPDPGIPAISVNNSTGERLEGFIKEGVEVSIQEPLTIPFRTDGSFDNGVVAHEYAHGISTRLTGGPSSIGCLSNSTLSEQMGEGWSDFFTLVTSTTEDDFISRTKSIGNYVNGADANSGGIRRKPYSTFEEINNQTYNDIIQSVAVHQVGEIWASVLWDLYWALVDEYGWDEDLIFGTGGNNIAIQLVMDGLKLQACDPGFIDGRNAILAADQMNNGGDNQCLIWEVFARRGLGFSAEQGDALNVKDGVEAFDKPFSCDESIKIFKQATPTIEPGTNIQFELTIRNDKPGPVTNVTIEDQLPQSSIVLNNSIEGAAVISSSNSNIVFDIGTLETGDEVTITYQVSTDVALSSNQLYFDDFEEDNLAWNFRSIEGENTWQRITDTLRNFERSWSVASSTTSSEQILELTEDIFITGEQPTIRFKHKYSTEPIADGGIIEISTDRGSTWTALSTQNFLRNTYNGELAFGTAFLSDQEAFWGLDDNLVESFADLSAYVGQEIRVRFHFFTDQEPEANPFVDGNGWTIDFVEVLDLLSYNTEACASSDNGDFLCTTTSLAGTFVEAGGTTTPTFDIGTEFGIKLDVFPNPTASAVQVKLASIDQQSDLLISLHTTDGRQVLSQQTSIITGEQQIIPLDLSAMPSGVYILQVQSENGLTSKRIVKE